MITEVNILQLLNVTTNLDWLIAGTIQNRTVPLFCFNALTYDPAFSEYVGAELLMSLVGFDDRCDELVRARAGSITAKHALHDTGFVTTPLAAIRSCYVHINGGDAWDALGGQAGPQRFGSYGWIQPTFGGVPGPLQRIDYQNSYHEFPYGLADGLFYYLPPGIHADIFLENNDWSKAISQNVLTGDIHYASS